MRLPVAALLLLAGSGFPLTVTVLEKEADIKGMGVESEQKITEYIASGYTKTVEEIKTTVSAGHSQGFSFHGGASKKKVRKEETIQVYKDGKIVNYRIFHGNKSYFEMETPAHMVMFGFVTMLVECSTEAKCTMKTKEKGLDVTDEFRKVGKWKARKVVATVKDARGRVIRTVMWVTKDSKLLLEAEKTRLNNLFREAEKDPKINSNPKVLDMMKQIKTIAMDFIDRYGAQVMTTSSIGEMTSTVVLKSVERKKVPESFFSVPEGYKPAGTGMPRWH